MYRALQCKVQLSRYCRSQDARLTWWHMGSYWRKGFQIGAGRDVRSGFGVPKRVQNLHLFKRRPASLTLFAKFYEILETILERHNTHP